MSSRYGYVRDVSKRNLLQPAAQQLGRVQCEKHGLYVCKRKVLQPAAQQLEHVQCDGYELDVCRSNRSTDRRFVCGTCKHTMQKCPGHVGKIEMATPVYNPVFVESTFRILRCVCFFCSKLLDTKLKKPISKHKQRRRLATISLNSRSIRRCPSTIGTCPK